VKTMALVMLAGCWALHAAPCEGDTPAADPLARTLNVQYEAVPLERVLADLAARSGAAVTARWEQFDGWGATRRRPITLHADAVPADVALELALAPVRGGFTVRDGVVLVSHVTDEALYRDVRVYDCRGLIGHAGATATDLTAHHRALAARARARAHLRAARVKGQDVITEIDTESSWFVAHGYTARSAAADPGGELARLITKTIEPDTWACAGGHGTIAVYGGRLIVRQNGRAHRQIAALLDGMRATGQPAPAEPAHQ